MLFTKITSPKENIYHAIRSTKILGVELEKNKLTVFIDNDIMPEISVTFDSEEEAERQYTSIIKELESIVI